MKIKQRFISVLSLACLIASSAAFAATGVTGAICNHTSDPVVLSTSVTFGPTREVIVLKNQSINSNQCQHLWSAHGASIMTIKSIQFKKNDGKVVVCKRYPLKFTSNALILFNGTDCRSKFGY